MPFTVLSVASHSYQIRSMAVAPGLIYNTDVKRWGKGSLSAIQSRAKQMGVQHRANSTSSGSSIDDVKVGYGLNGRGGNINRIGFKIRRHLVYVHKGVGKGVPISLVGIKGTRKPKPFLNEELDQKMPELADIVAKHIGDQLVGRIIIT